MPLVDTWVFWVLPGADSSCGHPHTLPPWPPLWPKLASVEPSLPNGVWAGFGKGARGLEGTESSPCPIARVATRPPNPNPKHPYHPLTMLPLSYFRGPEGRDFVRCTLLLVVVGVVVIVVRVVVVLLLLLLLLRLLLLIRSVLLLRPSLPPPAYPEVPTGTLLQSIWRPPPPLRS